jgi:SAM-dependent methyltransferase
MESNSISGDTAPNLHRKVLKILSKEKKGRLLDVPTGIGNLSSSLKEMGFEVLAGDIDETVFQPKDIEFQKVDLNEKLPYPDSVFDYIVCVEGIEHLENYYHLLREFGRILKKGGKLIITTPNVLSIFSRLRYLLIGYFDFFGGYYSDESQFYTFHINPVGFPQLYLALKRGGFCLESINANRNVISTRKFPARLLLWILFFCSKIITILKIKDDFMRKTLSSSELLMGEILILKCIRR